MVANKRRLERLEHLSWVVATTGWLWCFGVLLDIGMMIVSIMAYTGAQSEDDRTIIKHTHITFPTSGDHIQRLEIALPCLGLILSTTFFFYVRVPAARLENSYTRGKAQLVKRRILLGPLPWHVCCVAAWATCVALQAAYVPVLGAGRLPECEEFGSELSQCGMVTASWVLAMVYCSLHFLALLGLLAMLLLLYYEQKSEDRVIIWTPVRQEEFALPCPTPSRLFDVPRSAVIEGPSKVEGFSSGAAKP